MSFFYSFEQIFFFTIAFFFSFIYLPKDSVYLLSLCSLKTSLQHNAAKIRFHCGAGVLTYYFVCRRNIFRFGLVWSDHPPTLLWQTSHLASYDFLTTLFHNALICGVYCPFSRFFLRILIITWSCFKYLHNFMPDMVCFQVFMLFVH